MAIVHCHTPELSAFSVSSVRLRSGDRELPVYDIRKDNNGRGGIVDTPALGRSMAQSLGKDEALLLLGHGAGSRAPQSTGWSEAPTPSAPERNSSSS